MSRLLKLLDGQKTNLGLLALGILGICYQQGWVTEETAQTLGTLLAMWTGVSFRQAIKKIK